MPESVSLSARGGKRLIDVNAHAGCLGSAVTGGDDGKNIFGIDLRGEYVGGIKENRIQL